MVRIHSPNGRLGGLSLFSFPFPLLLSGRGLLLLRTRWLNFGSPRLWDAFVYFLIAPIVGVLMLRRHERARFSAYVFLSCEVLRAARIHSLPLGLLAVAFLIYLQTPAARRCHPSVDPRRVLARLRLKRNG